MTCYLYNDELFWLFEVMTNCLTSCRVFSFMTNLLTSWQTFGVFFMPWHFFYMITSFWQTFWSNDEHFVIMTCAYIMTNILTSGRTFWRHDVFWRYENIFSVMTSVLTSWRAYDSMTNFLCNQLFDVITYAAPFDIMENSFDVMKGFEDMTYFGRHDAPFDVMTNFLTSWCVLYVMIRFWCHWRHNIFFTSWQPLTSWQTFDVMTNLLTSWRVMMNMFKQWRTLCHHNMILTSWRTFFDVIANYLTSWYVLTSWRTYWSHDVFLTS